MADVRMREWWVDGKMVDHAIYSSGSGVVYIWEGDAPDEWTVVDYAPDETRWV